MATANPTIYSSLVQAEPGFEQVVQLFVHGLPTRLDAMQQALEIEDLQGLCLLAHQLKGSGSGHGYPVLSEKAAALEQHALLGELSALRAELSELRGLLPRICVRP